MFDVGQTVYHRTSGYSGKVVETDGQTVYIEQANGVEIDFPSGDLVLEAPEKKKPAGSPGHTPVLTMERMSDDHRRVLSTVPVRSVHAVAAAYESLPGSGKFSAFDDARKLNTICAMTGLSFQDLRKVSDQPGVMGLMIGAGLAKGAAARR